ncbi:MAG TPA: ribose-phosphate pyrophosphokinase [Azospirillum sp.]
MSSDDILVFDLDPEWGHGRRICDRLGLPLAGHDERRFDDGEIRVRAAVGVRGRDVYVVQPLIGDPALSAHDRLCRLLFFIAALKDASAGRVTAVVPYLAYARQDRRSKPRDPLTLRYVASLFEAVGTDRVMTIDVHNPAAFENAFRCPTEHLEARLLFVGHVVPMLGSDRPVVVSPDVGGVKRAERFREALGRALGQAVDMAFLEKIRDDAGIAGGSLVGAVAGCTVIIVDDLVSTGGTLVRAAAACRAAGCRRIMAVATHGVFAGRAAEAVGGMAADPAFAQLIVTDTIPPARLSRVGAGKLVVLEAAPLLADAIARVHGGGSIGDLLAAGPDPGRGPG